MKNKIFLFTTLFLLGLTANAETISTSNLIKLSETKEQKVCTAAISDALDEANSWLAYHESNRKTLAHKAAKRYCKEKKKIMEVCRGISSNKSLIGFDSVCQVMMKKTDAM